MDAAAQKQRRAASQAMRRVPSPQQSGEAVWEQKRWRRNGSARGDQGDRWAGCRGAPGAAGPEAATAGSAPRVSLRQRSPGSQSGKNAQIPQTRLPLSTPPALPLVVPLHCRRQPFHLVHVPKASAKVHDIAPEAGRNKQGNQSAGRDEVPEGCAWEQTANRESSYARRRPARRYRR